MFIQMPIPVSFYKGWNQLKNERLVKLAELCGLVFTGDFNESNEPEFIGNDKCWSSFKNQLTILN